MSSGLLTVICLCLAAPMATGLECITCRGTSTVISSDACVDAATNLTSTTCPSPSSGKDARCKFTRIESGAFGVTSATVSQECADVDPSTLNTCTTTNTGLAFVGTKTTMCHCNDKANCNDMVNYNGQTTLAPAIMTSLVGLAMAIYSVL